MNKKGFTLVELLIVLAIVSVASAGSILVFDRADSENNRKELKNTYVRIQRAAQIYLYMNDSWRNQFNSKGYMYLKIGELQNENFIETELIDPRDLEEIDSKNLIYVYIKDDKSVDSCILSPGEMKGCVANSDGDPCDCCLGANSENLQDYQKTNCYDAS